MEETKKFVCKFCNKRFPSGKSLGGHIRTHTNQHSSNNKAIVDSGKFESNEVVDDAERKKRKKRDLSSSSSDYGLRGNSRETKRFVVHNYHHKEKFCRECGKGFSSLKALCGHMACHSTEKVEKQKFSMVEDSRSDTETSDPEDLKRTRFMTLANSNNPTSSSSVLEVEQEGGGGGGGVEEVAMCLMLLSKGFYSHKGCFGLNKKSNSDARIVIDDGQNNKVKNSVYNASEIVKVGKEKMKLKPSDSGYPRYGSKNEESNVSIHGVLRNDVSNDSKVEDGYGFKKDYDDVFELRKMRNNNNRCYRSKNSESKTLVLGNSDKFNDPFNSAKRNYLGNNLDDEISCKKKKKTGFPNHDEVHKEDSYDSESSSYARSAEKSADSTDSNSFPYSYQKKPNKKAKKKVMKKSKKTKEHECPICNRTFRSGQALGGHKRSHFVSGFEENNINNTEIVKQESPSPSPPVVPCLIDLNLPAPVDE